MTIFLYNMKRLLRKKVNLVFMLGVPIVLITLTMWLNIGVGGIMTIGVADNDSTPLTQSFIQSLEGKANIKYIQESQVESQLTDQLVQYAIVIEEGFTRDLMDNKNPRLKGYSIQESNVAIPVKMNMESFLSSAKSIALSAGGDEEAFYEGLKRYKNGSFAVKNTLIGGTKSSKTNTIASMGFLVMSMLFLSSFSSMLILEDKQKKTFHRIFSSPVSLKHYMLQNILSFLLLSIIQVTVIFLIMQFVLNADLGPSIPNLFMVMVVFSLVCVSAGVAVSSISKDRRQAGLIASLFITPVCMIGGCFWPRSFMPEILRRISNFVPTTWVLQAVEKVLYGDTLFQAMTEILILLLFALVFFLLGTWRKADIAK